MLKDKELSTQTAVSPGNGRAKNAPHDRPAPIQIKSFEAGRDHMRVKKWRQYRI
jgi:hypothetical protein